MDMRGLSTFIADLRRDSAVTGGEKARVEKELAKIRSKFQSKGELSGYHRKKYVCKLMYINILGYEVDFGHIEAVKLISSHIHSEKTVGYLACNLLIEQESELITLLVNQVKIDLHSINEAHQCLALNFIANGWNKALADSVIDDVQEVFLNIEVRDRVRKKAAVALLQVIRNYDGYIDAERITHTALNSLDTHDLGGSNASLALIEYVLPMVENLHTEIFTKCVAVLSRIVLGKKTPNEYVYFGVPTPWTQTKLLRILQRIDPKQDTSLRSCLMHCLLKICNAAEKLLNDQLMHKPTRGVNSRINAMNSVFLDAICVIPHYQGELLVPKVSTVTGLYLGCMRDAYGTYVGLRTLSVFVQASPSARGENLQNVYRKVGDCIYHSDASIQRLAIDVMKCLATPENVEEIVGELLTYLDRSPSDIRTLLIETIMYVAHLHCKSSSWFINVSSHILRNPRRAVRRDVWVQLYRFIVSKPEAHAFAYDVFRESLREKNHCEEFLLVCAHVLKLCSTSGDKQQMVEFIRNLYSTLPNLTVSAQTEILGCFFEVYKAYSISELQSLLESIFFENIAHVSTEVQQCACEFYQYITCMQGNDKTSQGGGHAMQRPKLDFGDIFLSNSEQAEQSQHTNPSPFTSFMSNIDDMFGDLST